MVPNSRLKVAQSPCVTPASGSPAAAPGLSKNTRSVRALPLPRNSTSTTSSPLEAATRSAISRTRSSSSAMHPITYIGDARADLLQRKSGLAPTGVLRQMLVLHNSSQFSNIRPMGDKRQTHQAEEDEVKPGLFRPQA